MNNFRGEGFSKHPIYGSKRQFLASYMYLGRWRHSWPGLEDLARTNKLAARSETGHVSWLISGRIRFPFVHATLPSSASSRSGFPFTFGNLNFWRSAMPRLPPIFRIAAMMIPECSSIFVFLAFFLFFFFFTAEIRGPFSCSQGNNRIENIEEHRYFAESLAKITRYSPEDRIGRWLACMVSYCISLNASYGSLCCVISSYIKCIK